jgi:phospholipid-binding lipoprotein MlaA
MAIAAVCTAVTLGGCNVAPAGVQIHDPYEARNRQIHDFNKGLDTAIVRPVAVALARTAPEATDPVVNFADNIGLPGMVVNGILQFDIGGAATNTMRFLINSTLGIGGLLDPADAIGLFEESTDFGETLAVWGVPEGAYLELPVRGPSTERDAVGNVVDIFLDPLGWYGTVEQNAVATASQVAAQVIDRGRFAGTVDSVLYESADSYAQARLIYLQNRRFDLGQSAAGGAPGSAVDPYGDTCGDGFADPYADPAADPCTDSATTE